VILLVLAICSAAGAAVLFAGQALRARHDVRVALAQAAAFGGAGAGKTLPQRGRGRAEVVSERAARLAMALGRLQDADELTGRLSSAGLGRVTVERFLALKTGTAVAAALLGVLLGAETGNPALAVLFFALFAVAGFRAPDWYLGARRSSRREQIRSELPSVLDLLAVSVEAGLGLDAAIARVAEFSKGPLSDELALLLGRISVGASRTDALRDLAARVDAPELTAFVRALIQADRLGLSIARTLRVQAGEVRSRRQSAAEEQAEKAPVKMLFPTIFFIFPALFVVILGPAVLNFIQGFK
jgi:tight adherence protein C